MKYPKVFNNLLTDEVADELRNMDGNDALEFLGYEYMIPRDIVERGDVDSWAAGVLHGVKGDMEVYHTGDTFRCGSIPVWTLCNMLGMRPFSIRPVTDARRILPDLITDVYDLAKWFDTTPDKLPEAVNNNADYKTVISWNQQYIELFTIVPEADTYNSKSLRFPFDIVDYEDAMTGLMCWADATYWDAVKED